MEHETVSRDNIRLFLHKVFMLYQTVSRPDRSGHIHAEFIFAGQRADISGYDHEFWQ